MLAPAGDSMHARPTRTSTRVGADLGSGSPGRALTLALAVALLLVGCPSPAPRPESPGPSPVDVGAAAGAAQAGRGQGGGSARGPSAARPGADPLPVGLPPVGWADGQTAAGGGRWAVLVIADEFATGGPSWALQRAPEVLQRLQTTLPGALGIAAERTVVLRGKDVDPEAIEDALLDVGGKLEGPDNLVLVYYYGHGYTRRARDAHGQEQKSLELFMHRTRSLEGDLFDRTLGHRDLGRFYAGLRAAARKRGATARLVSVVDACRVELQAPGGPVTLTPLDDVVELFSASPGQFAEEGLFARAFCEALARGAQADVTRLGEVVEATAGRIAELRGSQRPELLQGDRSLVLRRQDDLVLGVEVTDATRPGRRVDGARVTLAGRPTADASAGPARFDGLRPGQYAWQVEAPGYFWRTGEQEVSRAQAGGVLRVALLPRAALVEGELVNPDGTVVTVKVLGGRSPSFLEGYHVDQARVVGSGPFALRLPEVTDETELSLTLGDRPLLRVRPAKAPAEPVVWGELRVPRHGLGKLDLTGRAAADRVEDLGTSLTAAQVRLPELAFAETQAGRECAVVYQQVRAQVARDRAEQLALAADELEALRAHVAPASRPELARLAAELRLEVLVRRRVDDPLSAREALCALLGAGPGWTPRPGARPAPAAALAEHPGTLDRARAEAVRWLSSDADAAGQRRDWAGQTGLLARALALATEPRVLAVLEAQHADAWAQRVDAALERALADDGWAAAEQELGRARQALEARAEATLGALALRFEQERMPRAARALVQRGHDAYAAGRLEEAVAHYEAALPDCNAHASAIVTRQVEDVRFRLFRRYFVLADEALADGRRPEAARAVLEAQRYGSPERVANLARRLTEADWRACAPAWALARTPLPAPWTFLLGEAEAAAAPAWVLAEPRRPPAWAWPLRARPAAWVLARTSPPPRWAIGLAQEPAAWALAERAAPPAWALGLPSRPPTWALSRAAAPPAWALARPAAPPAWTLELPDAPPEWAFALGSRAEYLEEQRRRSAPRRPDDLPVGARVARGPDWKWEDQDGGPGKQGTVIESADGGGWVRVRWDTGQVNGYRWNGEGGPCDLVLLSSPGGAVPAPATGRPGAAAGERPADLPVGTRVARGPDWKWEDQDGGPGKQGSVIRGRNDDGWVRVRWDAGEENAYRWNGEGGKYDLVVLAPATGPAASTPSASVLPADGAWPVGVTLSYGGWRLRRSATYAHLWTADLALAVELFLGSNGWWRIRRAGTEHVVFPVGTTDPQAFHERPWAGAQPQTALMRDGALREKGQHGTTSVTCAGGTIGVRLPGGTSLVLHVDGRWVDLHDPQGKLVKRFER